MGFIVNIYFLSTGSEMAMDEVSNGNHRSPAELG
jgi:hypothetical protein